MKTLVISKHCKKNSFRYNEKTYREFENKLLDLRQDLMCCKVKVLCKYLMKIVIAA